MEKICTYSENTQNEVILRMKFRCSYTENMRNESVCILIIHPIVYVYQKYAECMKS
jgi:hypothetical protein